MYPTVGLPQGGISILEVHRRAIEFQRQQRPLSGVPLMILPYGALRR